MDNLSVLNTVQGSGATAMKKIDKTQPSGNLHSMKMIHFGLVVKKINS